jgi:hypothetical protein
MYNKSSYCLFFDMKIMLILLINKLKIITSNIKIKREKIKVKNNIMEIELDGFFLEL